jgi:ceramide glucosyltransferase
VLVAREVEPLRYCFGATMAVRRDVLEAIGGLNALGAHLADDYRLGELVTGYGLRVELAPYVVENILSEEGFETLWSRELRWSRTIRGVRPAGYALSFLTFGLPLAGLAFALRGRRALPLFLAAASLRLALHYAARDALGSGAAASPQLIPLRDALTVAVWVAGFLDRRVRWSGDDLDVDENGRIENGTPQ